MISPPYFKIFKFFEIFNDKIDFFEIIPFWFDVIQNGILSLKKYISESIVWQKDKDKQKVRSKDFMRRALG